MTDQATPNDANPAAIRECRVTAPEFYDDSLCDWLFGDRADEVWILVDRDGTETEAILPIAEYRRLKVIEARQRGESAGGDPGSPGGRLEGIREMPGGLLGVHAFMAGLSPEVKKRIERAQYLSSGPRPPDDLSTGDVSH